MSRHVPTAEDPTVEGASQLIGGRWGRHAGGGHSWWWTPLEAAMVITILVLIGGYLQKAQCLVRPTVTITKQVVVTKDGAPVLNIDGKPETKKETIQAARPYTNEYQYTRLCYTDTYVLYGAEQLNADVAQTGPDKGQVVGNVGVPYRDHPVEYPPVIGGLMWAAAEVTSHLRGGGHADPNLAHAKTFFNLTALGLAVCALLITFGMARLVGKRREWDVLMVALSPVLFMDAFINWDLVAVACTVIGLVLWAKKWPTWAGAMLGIGIATKLVPGLVLLGLLLLCARERKWRAAVLAIAGAAVAIVVMYVPAIVLSHETSKAVLDAKGSTFLFPSSSCATAYPLRGWRWFSSLSQQRGTDWGGIWLVVQHVATGLESHFTGSGFVDRNVHHALATTNKALSGSGSCSANPTALNWIASVSIGLVVVGVAALVFLARRRPRVGQVAFLLVAAFIMLNKVDSPQYALWLVPLAVLARPRWLSLMVWQISEVVLGAANLYTLIALDHSDQGLPISTYLIFVVIRDVILIWLMAMVVREVLDPGLDLVRRDGVDDPAGGVLVEADPGPNPDPGPGPDVPDDRLVGAPA